MHINQQVAAYIRLLHLVCMRPKEAERGGGTFIPILVTPGISLMPAAPFLENTFVAALVPLSSRSFYRMLLSCIIYIALVHLPAEFAMLSAGISSETLSALMLLMMAALQSRRHPTQHRLT